MDLKSDLRGVRWDTLVECQSSLNMKIKYHIHFIIHGIKVLHSADRKRQTKGANEFYTI